MELKKLIRNYIAENPGCNFMDIASKSGICSGIRCEDIWEALRVLADPETCGNWNLILIEGPENLETFRLAPGSECMEEAVQDITLNCFPKMQYEDSREALRTLRLYAHRFENWWWHLKESDRDRIGYFDAIDEYCDYIINPHPGVTREENLQEFTAVAIETDLWDTLFNKKNLSREDCFKVIRDLADEFFNTYEEQLDIFDTLEKGCTYYDFVDAFLKKKKTQIV